MLLVRISGTRPVHHSTLGVASTFLPGSNPIPPNCSARNLSEMGREVSERRMQTPLQNRPAILMVGSSNAGKRTLLSRLTGEDFSDMENISTYSCYGLTIDTKYYTADVSIWVEHLGDEFPVSSSPTSQHPSALVLVFDLNNISSFVALQDWVSANELHNFEILLCVGNKADLIPSHFAHTEYRRRLQKRGERTSDPHPEFLDYGILDIEGFSLLGGEEGGKEVDLCELRNLCLSWCQELNIEYVEACAANADFDKCLSRDGDLQGVDRIYGALSAYMWPGLVMKSEKELDVGNPASVAEDVDLFSDEESDIEIEYEVLSKGSVEPWDDTDYTWVSVKGPDSSGDSKELINRNNSVEDQSLNSREPEELPKPDEIVSVVEETSLSLIVREDATESEHKDTMHRIDDLEQLMCEISHVRENLRLMPDIQRKEMAAKLAMKMATMFADSSDDDVN